MLKVGRRFSLVWCHKPTTRTWDLASDVFVAARTRLVGGVGSARPYPLTAGDFSSLHDIRVTKLHIRRAIESDAGLLTDIIRRAFRDVAERFHLTLENCPTHPSNHTMEKVQAEFRKGVLYYVAEVDGKAIGCVALEKADQNIFYLERLAVRPDERKQGIGEALVRHVFQLAAAEEARAVSIAIIAQQTELQRWYEAFGFVFVEHKHLAHLPFDVTFMKCEIGKRQQ